jgi:hypothetical protein
VSAAADLLENRKTIAETRARLRQLDAEINAAEAALDKALKGGDAAAATFAEAARAQRERAEAAELRRVRLIEREHAEQAHAQWEKDVENGDIYGRRHPPEPPKADGIEVPPEPEPPSAKKLEAEDKALRGFISGIAPAADAAKKYADLLAERDALRALMAEACAATSSLLSAAQDAAALADARLAEEEARRRQELAALEATRDETAGRIAKLRKLLGMK